MNTQYVPGAVCTFTEAFSVWRAGTVTTWTIDSWDSLNPEFGIGPIGVEPARTPSISNSAYFDPVPKHAAADQKVTTAVRSNGCGGKATEASVSGSNAPLVPGSDRIWFTTPTIMGPGPGVPCGPVGPAPP